MSRCPRRTRPASRSTERLDATDAGGDRRTGPADSGAEVVGLLTTGSAFLAPGMSAARMVLAMVADSGEVHARRRAGRRSLRNPRTSTSVSRRGSGADGVREIVELPLAPRRARRAARGRRPDPCAARRARTRRGDAMRAVVYAGDGRVRVETGHRPGARRSPPTRSCASAGPPSAAPTCTRSPTRTACRRARARPRVRRRGRRDRSAVRRAPRR